MLMPPSGSLVLTTGGSGELASLRRSGYNSMCFANAKSALAAALVAHERQGRKKHGRVGIPGYCCPDVVASVLAAGYKPVAIDFESDSPTLNINSGTILDGLDALIAVNFFGITGVADNQTLRQFRLNGGVLIEDRALAYPSDVISADYVVTSFGRGKCINLLGGGILWSKEPLTQIETAFYSGRENKALWVIKARLFNMLWNRPLYGLISRIPAFGIGKTEFSDLEKIETMPAWKQSYASASAEVYLNRPSKIVKFYQRELLLDGIVNLGKDCSEAMCRYPILLKSEEIRNSALGVLLTLGVSPLYGDNIRRFVCIETKGRLSESKRFANHMLTLPTHSQISLEDAKHIVSTLRKLLS